MNKTCIVSILTFIVGTILAGTMQFEMGIAPASGAVGRALAARRRRTTGRTVWFLRTRSCSARGRAERQPGRLRSLTFQLHRSGLGGGTGTVIGVLHYGAKVSQHVRFFEEARLGKDGLKSFEAYQKEPSAIGIYALQRHLEELGTVQKRAGTNVVFLHGSDITWMQVLAHVRLSKLFAKVGELEKTTNEMKSAMTLLPEVLWRDTPKSPDGLRAYVDGADKKGSWL